MSRKRLYDLVYPSTGEPAYFEDFGSDLKISGLVIEGMGLEMILFLPTSAQYNYGDEYCPECGSTSISPTMEEWCEIIRRSDDPLFFETDETGTIKAIHRKVQRAISGGVQWLIWKRDGFRCLYCGKDDQMLTVDHWVPVQLGGEDRQDNYISCCRQCNKKKGHRDPKEWCEAEGLDHFGLTEYLAGKCSVSFISHLSRR